MRSLFIIGNGFDLSYGLKTNYEDFHQYLRNEYPNAKDDEFTIPESTLMPDGDEVYNDDVVVSYLLWIISNAEPYGDKWSDIENSLGYLDFDEIFDSIPEIEDKDGDSDFSKNSSNVDIMASNLINPTIRISKFFLDWINTIEINEKISKIYDFKQLINKDSNLFLTFNYTKTLEVLYQTQNVCHIHGEQGSNIIFGHGNKTSYFDENMSKYPGSERALQEIHYYLRKDTSEAINNHQDFFDNLSSINKIYSYGFSFSEVDQLYIQEICRKLPTAEITWYLNDFDSYDKREQFKIIIRSCGFKGQFCKYHIYENLAIV